MLRKKENLTLWSVVVINSDCHSSIQHLFTSSMDLINLWSSIWCALLAAESSFGLGGRPVLQQLTPGQCFNPQPCWLPVRVSFHHKLHVYSIYYFCSFKWTIGILAVHVTFSVWYFKGLKMVRKQIKEIKNGSVCALCWLSTCRERSVTIEEHKPLPFTLPEWSNDDHARQQDTGRGCRKWLVIIIAQKHLVSIT